MGACYNQKAGHYDLLDRIYFRNDERSPRRAMLGLIPGGAIRVLELCCGTGENLALVARNLPDARVIGIDLSESMLTIAKQQLDTGNAELMLMDATQTSFDDSCFDVVLISLALHELSGDVAAKMLAEAKRVLKPDGHLIVIEWEAPSHPLRKLLFMAIRLGEPPGFDRFLLMDMAQYFSRHGFAITSETHCDYSRVLALSPIQE